MAILKRNRTFKSMVDKQNGIIFYTFEVEYDRLIEYEDVIKCVLYWKGTRIWVNNKPVDPERFPQLIDKIKQIQEQKILRDAEKIINKRRKKEM